MRSRLEATVAAWLDRKQFRWTYEPNAFADLDGQYLPDFRIDGLLSPDIQFHQVAGIETTTTPVPWYVEVKPERFDENAVLRRMEIIWSSDPDAVLLLVSPRYVSLDWPLGEAGGWAKDSLVNTCQQCNLVSIVDACGWYRCIRCAAYDGDHYLGATPESPFRC